MELKRYQERALERLSEWFHFLEEHRSPATAWEAMEWEGNIPVYRPRRDSSRRPISHVCLRVPTGGGKTLLAAEAIARSNRRTGLVLWMVPNKAIYGQTKKALWSREHPYRQALERASGGRVKVLEKGDNFQLADTKNYLCVMLVSVQSANRRQNPEFLKMFQESGAYSTFFPDEDDPQGWEDLHSAVPGLDAEEDRVQRTLANVLKICRPIIILDEAHKAYGGRQDELWQGWVDRFDPTFVLELSATPDRTKSNILVDISGLDLKDEEMIKLPINVRGHEGLTWKDVLREASTQLEELFEKAIHLHDSDGRHIRPMAIVRVTRTGANQRHGTHLHAEDVREFLISNLGVPNEQVKVQSGTANELGGVDLVAEECNIKWIITKDALKEGWDCSYAYILVLLDNTSANVTVTQMLGRVLRQPHARLTEIRELDQCYVYCSDVRVDQAILGVKNQLEKEGFGDLITHILPSLDSAGIRKEKILRREAIEEDMARLPQVLRRDGSRLDYRQHILADLDWDSITVPSEWGDLLMVGSGGSVVLDLEESGIRELHLSDYNPSEGTLNEDFDLAWYARQMRDVIPNPWQAARLVSDAVAQLFTKGKDYKWIHKRRASFLRRLLQHVEERVEEQAERIFRQKLVNGEIKFDMEMPFEFRDWYEIDVPANEIDVNMQKTLFSPFYTHGLNELEKGYAVWLNREKSILWWHRVAARSPGDYRLQGWRRDYVYPDFVALRLNDQIIVHDTKGKHLEGNDDTRYKQRLLECLQNHFNDAGVISIRGESMTGNFKIVFDDKSWTLD